MFPAIRIQLSCSNQALDLGDEGFDLGIRVSFSPDHDLVARKLAANRATMCATPDYLERFGRPQTIEDLSDHRCVLFTAVSSAGHWTDVKHWLAASLDKTIRLQEDYKISID